ncbi:serine threonine protein kinase, partial [Colletotrichum incanum]
LMTVLNASVVIVRTPAVVRGLISMVILAALATIFNVNCSCAMIISVRCFFLDSILATCMNSCRLQQNLSGEVAKLPIGRGQQFAEAGKPASATEPRYGSQLLESEMTYYSGVFEHFLFLSWAGLPLFDYTNQTTKIDIVNKVAAAYKRIHRLHILHHDAEPRNIMYDQKSGNVMIVDFERAEFRSRRPLGSPGPNDQNHR